MHYYAIILEYKTDLKNIESVTAAHRDHLKKGYDAGFILISGPQIPRSGGFILARCNDKSGLEEFFSEDPYMKNNYADYKFIEFDPKSYQAFIKNWISAE